MNIEMRLLLTNINLIIFFNVNGCIDKPKVCRQIDSIQAEIEAGLNIRSRLLTIASLSVQRRLHARIIIAQPQIDEQMSWLPGLENKLRILTKNLAILRHKLKT